MGFGRLGPTPIAFIHQKIVNVDGNMEGQFVVFELIYTKRKRIKQMLNS